MGKLQDNYYINKIETPQEKLQAEFCSVLDTSLIEAIWNDTFDYKTSFDILTTLAQEAEQTLNEQEFEAALSTGDESTTATTLSTVNFEANTEQDNMQFLLTCFPTIALDELKDALQTQDNDVEKATDLLLNKDAITDDEYFDIAKLKEMEDEVEEAFFIKMEKKKQAKKKLTLEQLESTLQEQLQLEKRREITVTMDKIAFYFPTVNKKVIQDIVEQYDGNVLLSVKRIMEKENSAQPEDQFRDWDSMKALVQVKDTLETVLVDQTSDDIYRVSIAAFIQEEQKSVQHIIQVAMDFLLNNQNPPHWTLVQPSKKPIQRLKQVVKKELPVIPDYLLLNNQHEYIEDDPLDCREKANDLILERNELYRKAAASYRRSKNKGPGESGVAYFYSDSARKLDEQAKEWNMRAAKAIIRQQRIKHNDEQLLDFHGLTVAEARVMLVEGITQWWSRSEMQSSRHSIKPLKIITGVGNHSQGQQSKLLPMTLKYLKAQNWSYQMPNPGCIIVNGLK